MNKKEFLGASLHTGLHVGQHRCGKIEPYPFYGMKHVRSVDKISCYIDDKEHGDYQNSWIDGVTPIARPISDLNKSITHNGETFIPIVELAKIAEFVPNGIDKEFDELCLCDDYTVSFFYEKESFIAGRINYKENNWIDDLSVPNQLQLFQKLIEWHFNLMDESEPFIPVTDEFNPYK